MIEGPSLRGILLSLIAFLVTIDFLLSTNFVSLVEMLLVIIEKFQNFRISVDNGKLLQFLPTIENFY